MSIEIRVDSRRSRLYVTFTGLAADEEVRAAADRFIAAAGQLKPGFTAVTDLSDSRPLSQAGVAEVKRAVEGGVKLGMRAVARVLHHSTVVSFQFSRVSTEFGYPVFTVTSLADADRLLDAEMQTPTRVTRSAIAAVR